MRGQVDSVNRRSGANEGAENEGESIDSGGSSSYGSYSKGAGAIKDVVKERSLVFLLK